MVELLFSLLERLAVIVTIAFIATRIPQFRQLISQQDINNQQRVLFTILFGIFGIIGTYASLTVDTNSLTFSRYSLTLDEDQALANSRVIGVVLAGLLGGMWTGVGAGLIAGLHRFFLGGFTAFACGLSAVIAGILAGYIHRKVGKEKYLSVKTAFFTGAAAETVQMGVILILARPFTQSLQLVSQIGLPMIVANGLGSALFVMIIRSVIHEEEKTGALQAQKALRLAELTLHHLRQGLNDTTAAKTCAILLKETRASAVALTDQDKIIAHVGLAEDHHRAPDPIHTVATKKVIETGQLSVITKESIQCDDPNCPLTAGVIAPLKIRGETAGTLKFYYSSRQMINPVSIELVKGLSALLSQQLEIAESEKYIQLARQSEIKALQAQISPHFLFNGLNTIVSLVRTNPGKARKLLVSLSRYLRQNLTATRQEKVSLRQELNHVKAYLEIEEARFEDKLKVNYDIDESALSKQVPPLTLQPIVENALKHGLKPKANDGRLQITIEKDSNNVEVTVTDNGAGIDPDVKERLFKKPINSENGGGIGLYNVNRRLIMTYGDRSQLQIESGADTPTTVSFTIPTGGN